MQPAAHGLRGAVRHEEETPDRDEADVATLAAMFPHVPAPVLRRTLAIGGSADHAATLLLENDWRSFEPRHPRFTAARSVHLDFRFGPGGGAQAFYNECVVEQHAPGSYFVFLLSRDFGASFLSRGPFEPCRVRVSTSEAQFREELSARGRD